MFSRKILCLLLISVLVTGCISSVSASDSRIVPGSYNLTFAKMHCITVTDDNITDYGPNLRVLKNAIHNCHLFTESSGYYDESEISWPTTRVDINPVKVGVESVIGWDCSTGYGYVYNFKVVHNPYWPYL